MEFPLFTITNRTEQDVFSCSQYAVPFSYARHTGNGLGLTSSLEERNNVDFGRAQQDAGN